MVRTLVLVAALALPAVASAAELHVGIGQAYGTVQAAVNVARTGDVIVVHAGTYAEQVVIDDVNITSLTIKAAGDGAVTIDGPDNKVNTIIAHSVNLKIKGVTIEAPARSSPAPRAINAIAASAGSTAYTLRLCSVTLRDHDVTGGYGVGCATDTGDVMEVDGRGVEITNLWGSVEGTCSYTGGWEIEDSFCAF